jgi:hypothetical protein
MKIMNVFVTVLSLVYNMFTCSNKSLIMSSVFGDKHLCINIIEFYGMGYVILSRQLIRILQFASRYGNAKVLLDDFVNL